MGVFKHMVCRGTFYYLCGVQDQRIWNDLMLTSLGVTAQPLLDDLWYWATECASHHEHRHQKLLNCWEVLNCGYGGGKCRASSEARLHGIHGGENAGRACWAIPRTLCQGRDESKCQDCPFRARVIREQLDYVLNDKSLKSLLQRR